MAEGLGLLFKLESLKRSFLLARTLSAVGLSIAPLSPCAQPVAVMMSYSLSWLLDCLSISLGLGTQQTLRDAACGTSLYSNVLSCRVACAAVVTQLSPLPLSFFAIN